METPCRADLNDAAEVLRQADIGRADVCCRVAAWLDRMAYVPAGQADADGHAPLRASDVARRFRQGDDDVFALGGAAAPTGALPPLTTPGGRV